MKHNQKNLTLIALMVVALFTIYISCAPNKSDNENRHSFYKLGPNFQNGQTTAGDSSADQVEAVLEEVSSEEALKRREELREDTRELFNAFSHFPNALPADVYHFLKDTGRAPLATKNEIRMVVSSDSREPVKNGLRYFSASFEIGDAGSMSPSSFTFEVMPFNQSLSAMHSLIEEEFSGLNQACDFDGEHIVYEFEEEFLITLKKVTEQDIEEGHPVKARSDADLNSIVVSIERNPHPGACGVEFEEHEHDH